MERKNAWKSYSKSDEKKLEELCEGYKDYLFKGKTEREGTAYIIGKAKEAGYISLEEAIKSKKKLKAGDKIYSVCMGKTVALFNIGKKSMEEGMNILGAHLDSPRLDVKQNPLYESNDLAYLDTHYYGGIKKYQWVTLPLAIHGVVVKTDGTKVLPTAHRQCPSATPYRLLSRLSPDAVALGSRASVGRRCGRAR